MARRDNVVTPDSWLPRGEASCSRIRPPTAVWQGIPGEKCKIHVYAPGKNRSLARWEGAVGQPSPRRVDPPCPRYSTCGGCPWMHVDAQGQAKGRVELVRTAYDLHGLAEHAPRELRASPDGLEGYRHLMKLAVGRSDRGHPRVGAFGRSSRNVVPIPGCRVLAPALPGDHAAGGSPGHRAGHLALGSRARARVLRYVIVRQSRAAASSW